MMVRMFAATSAILAMVAACHALAVPVSYDDDTEGDLPPLGLGGLEAGLPLTTFIFDVGANTVAGNTGRYGLNISGHLVFIPDFDSFAFTVPVGMEVVAAQVQLTDTVGDIQMAHWNLFDGSLNQHSGLFMEAIYGYSPGMTVLTSTPLDAGDYNISFGGLEHTEVENGVVSADYAFTFTLRAVSGVPEPATLTLLGIGLAGIGLTRRKRAEHR